MYGVPSVSLQKLQNYPCLPTNLAAAWTNHIVMKNGCQQQDKLYRNAQTRAICFTAPMCQKLPPGLPNLFVNWVDL